MSGTIIAIGLDKCADTLESAQFEVCWRDQQHRIVGSGIREVIIVEGAENLPDLAAASKAQIVQIEDTHTEWRFQSTLYDRSVAMPILKACISAAEYMPIVGCVEFLEGNTFSVPPEAFGPDYLYVVVAESLTYMV